MLQIDTCSKKRMETNKNNINTKTGQNEPKQPITRMRTREKKCKSNNSSSSSNNNNSNNKEVKDKTKVSYWNALHCE